MFRQTTISSPNFFDFCTNTTNFQDPQHEVLMGLLYLDCGGLVCGSVLQIEPCDWLTRFMRVILPCLSLVDAGLNSVNRFYSKDSKVCVQKCTQLLAVSLCTVHLYSAVRSSDHGDLSRKNLFDHASLSNKETIDV